jgi:hypothetical protein
MAKEALSRVRDVPDMKKATRADGPSSNPYSRTVSARRAPGLADHARSGDSADRAADDRANRASDDSTRSGSDGCAANALLGGVAAGAERQGRDCKRAEGDNLHFKFPICRCCKNVRVGILFPRQNTNGWPGASCSQPVIIA